MTTVERYRTTQLDLPPDVPTNVPRTKTGSLNTVTRDIPPAVPSPPRLSTRSSPPRKPTGPTRLEIAVTMASEGSSQWLFTEAELANTPSVLEGLPIAEERCRRAKGVNFIIQAGILLKLPQLTLATASVFFHRFYMRHSMVVENGKTGIHHYLPRSKSYTNLKSKAAETKLLTFESLEQNIAATSLFLATKTEENCRKTKEIVIAVAKVAQKNSSLIIDEQSKEYWRWRDSILLHEELMLELLTFDVVLASPYNYLYQFIQKLQIEDNKPLRNAAWAFLNDSSLTMMCLLVPPQDIAVASIYFAARYTQTQIADNDGDPWWEQIGGRPEMITKAVAVINEFYSENPLKRSENPYEQSPNAFGHEDDLDRTRSTNESFREETPQSQRSQNGHHEPAGGPGSPTRNGAKQGDPDGQKPESPKGPVVVSTVPTDGSSNKPLKEAANYPATHEHDVNGRTNGTSELQNTSLEPASKSPAKRKELTSAGEPSSKRQKPESEESKQQLPKSENVDVPKANTAGNDEASEEGELEE